MNPVPQTHVRGLGKLSLWGNGPQLFLLTLVAHIAFGIALGLLIQSLLKEEDRVKFSRFLPGPGRPA